MHVVTKELSIQSRYYKEILSILKLNGGVARIVGGAVRDAILNVVNYDIDIATNLLPKQVTDILSKANITVIPTGIKHGTVTALVKNEKFEITTLRKDIKCDGRSAEVIFTDDFMEDATRRDFTINALSYCPFEHKIYDYFGGIDDLRQSKVIFIGQAFERIQEDFLRILRFFRFSCYYAAQLDLDGLNACIKLKENLRLLSKERIKWEMDKLIISDNSPDILQQMFDNGILQIILPVSQFDKKYLSEAISFGSLETMSFLRKQESKEIDRKGVLDILDPCFRRDDIMVSRDNIKGSRDERSRDIYDGTMSFLRKQESKEIDRKDVLNILDPCFRRDDIMVSRDDIQGSRDDIEEVQMPLSLAIYTRYSLLFYHIKNLSLSDLLNLKFSRQIAVKITTILKVINREINEFVLREIWLENGDYLQYISVLVSLGKVDRTVAKKFLDRYSSIPRPIFPIKGHDLQKLNIHGKAIGILLDKLKKDWIESDFTFNKNQLLKLLLDNQVFD
ncbi:CCA tRNA nucleotidyltransferase [Candidatus Tisiphia endosymbiont of Ditula angustiorana]|uniref:CCA tRNA nucleotidyltransferase n=1 Tax=Candidatus Tisiphia endosymbiont of Ditula angustiorana TaxID=3066272 RepID=UPI0039776B22